MGYGVRVRRNFYLRDIIKSPPVPADFLRSQGNRLLAQVKQRTLATQDDRGSSFKPLSPQYAKWKRARYPGKPILVRTGRMLGALVVRATSTMFKLEFDNPDAARIAGYHQRGTRKMPARRWQGIPDQWARDMRQAVRAQVRAWLAGKR